MQTGAITGYIDVAQITLYAFWIFFAGLIFYLRREDKREGYPLEADRAGRMRTSPGFPAFPGMKAFFTTHGPRTVPSSDNDRPNVAVAPVAAWPGAPMQPTGNPMLDGVGPASWADREDVPELNLEGLPAIVPLRTLPATVIEPQDPDPRGMPVIAGDRRVAGTVTDVWVDRAEALIRYLEVAVDGVPVTRMAATAAPATAAPIAVAPAPVAASPVAPAAVPTTGVPPTAAPAAVAAARTVLVPITMARVNARRGAVTVRSIFAHHFADVPRTAHPDQVTKREEDRIAAYFAGGTLYASPDRLGPLL